MAVFKISTYFPFNAKTSFFVINISYFQALFLEIWRVFRSQKVGACQIGRSQSMCKFTSKWVAHNHYRGIPPKEIRELCWNECSVFQCRPVETGGSCSPPRFLLTCIFHELKKVVLKWKKTRNWKLVETFERFLTFLSLLLTSAPEIVSCQ